MAKVHDRILQFALTADESDDSLLCTAVTYFQNRGQLDASAGLSKKFTAGVAATSHEITLGEVLPPPTHVRFVATFQA